MAYKKSKAPSKKAADGNYVMDSGLIHRSDSLAGHFIEYPFPVPAHPGTEVTRSSGPAPKGFAKNNILKTFKGD